MAKPDHQFPLRVKAVTIDLDGTLVDSVPDLAVAANLMLRELGRAELSPSLIRTFVGKGVPRLVERALAGALDGSIHVVDLEDGARIRVRCHGNPAGERVMVTHGNGFAADAYLPFWQHLTAYDLLVYDFRNPPDSGVATPRNGAVALV